MMRNGHGLRLALLGSFLLMLGWAQIREDLSTEFAAHVGIIVKRSDTGAVLPARIYLFKGETPFRLSPVDSHLPLRVDLFYRERLWRRQPQPQTLEVTARDFSHFYLLNGQAGFELPAGSYRLEVYRGLFFKPQSVTFSVNANEDRNLEVLLDPIAPGRQEAWLAADDHIHLMRAREDDPVFLKWLAAEDLAVGNFLELQRQQHAAVQYGWGSGAEARAPGFSIRSGHESRSVMYGHTLFLGVNEMIRPLSVGAELANSPDSYPFPTVLFARGRDAGGLTGYAHFYGSTPHSSLLANLVRNSIDFVELFQFGVLHTPEWYELLNAGFRVTGLAGSDFPVPLNRQEQWPRAIPPLGPERALVRAQPGRSAYESWAAGVKAGAVLLSNGPLLEFGVNGKTAGDQVNWKGDSLSLGGRAEAWFHRPIEKIEIVLNGQVVAFAGLRGQTHETLDFSTSLAGSGWVAARVKAQSLPGEPEIWAHSNPVYFLRDGQPVRLAAARASIRARWRLEAEYYRNGGLFFADPARREDLIRLVEETTQALASD